ncbi:hypothetical protein AVEN_167188-1 [Araneus ventricosus]|uniref:Uncharacterized protein n=1 Tax=Araneus ventricosus TaxID=182803 RepID=A0A4Y2VCE3_ARAVE|nr:hypothetical protein AVEN_90687-1 [Araneus ventricosus]GBO22202.1 hypothetical protein AVEN_167188-1 [Araneus ventricosus]
MAAMNEKSLNVLEYAKCSSVTSVQRAFLHWSTIVRDFLNRELPRCWIGRAGLDDVPLLPWASRSPDPTPCDFFLWSYAKDKVYVPPIPTTLQALQERVTAPETDIDGNMLLNVWTELDYRCDTCQVTKGAHIEHLQYVPETW